MRWLLATIVLINLLAYYWFSGQSAPVLGGPKSSHASSGIPSLLLLSDVESKYIPAIVESSPQLTEPEMEIIGGAANQQSLAIDECWVLGPVIDESIPLRLASEMNDFGFSVTAKAAEPGSQPGFWVYLPPFKSVDALEAQRQALAAQGIESFVFRNGKLKNGISLGYFNSEENAQARQEGLALRGIPSQLGSSGSIASSVWMLMSAQAFESLSSGFWLDMSRISPDLEVQAMACDIK